MHLVHYIRFIYLERTTITLGDKDQQKMATESLEATKKRTRTKLRRIVVSEHNYFALKSLGFAGDSFNDIISRLLLIEKNYQGMKRKKKQEEQQQDNNNNSYDSSVDSTFISSSSLSAMFTDQSSRQELAELVRWLRQSKKRKN